MKGPGRDTGQSSETKFFTQSLNFKICLKHTGGESASHLKHVMQVVLKSAELSSCCSAWGTSPGAQPAVD